jgi:hypothetical protein
MEQRMQALADNKALRDREHAKSEYDRTMKAASQEQAQIQALRSAGHLDDKDQYTDTYWRDTTMDLWDKKAYAKQEDFINVYKQGRAAGFQRQFKNPNEIAGQLRGIYDAIDQRQVEESGKSALTGFDQMLGRGFVKEQAPDEPETPIPSLDATVPSAPVETLEDKGKFFEAAQPEPKSIQQVIKDDTGNNFAVFANDKGEMTKVNLTVNSGVPSTPRGNRKTEKVRLFDRDKGFYFDEAVNRDIDTGEVFVNGEWSKPSLNIATMPADVKLQKLEYTDPDSGDEMSAQAYPTVGSATGPNVVRMPDGTTWAITGQPVLLRGKRDVHDTSRGKIPETTKENLKLFGQQRKTASLANLMLRQDFISSPTQWAAGNMSVMTDMLGATFGMVGENRPKDLDAIAKYINSEIQDSEELRNSIGYLDAAAVRSGERAALENFLVYALARSQYGGGKLTVQAVEQAEDVVKPVFRGSEFNRGSLQTIIARSSDSMALIAGADITLALGQGSVSKIWDYYPRVKQKVDQGLTPVPETVDGDLVVSDIKRLEKTNKAAYDATVRNMVDRLGANWEEALKKPIRYDSRYDTIVMPMYLKNEDGSYTFGVFPAK